MIPIPLGFRFAGVRCGLKNKRNDLGIVVSDVPARAAGVLTLNQVRAACVDLTRSVLNNGVMQAIVVNSGNANCCTGVQGARDALRMSELASDALGFPPENIGVASTGVIGQLLDMSKVQRGVDSAAISLDHDPRPFMDAILTTDLVEKWALRSQDDPTIYNPTMPVPEDTARGKIFGVAKGSGMIAPNMATMLAFLMTDFELTGYDLPAILKRAADVSFNCMTVDGDTSTNDMLLLMANGVSGVRPSEAEFEQMLTDVCVSLAKQVARDGEGATKLVEVRVRGTENPKQIARTIADSPLVKTAMFGCDPNWGRIMMAAGRAGVPFDPREAVLNLIIGGEAYALFEHGTPAPFDPQRVSTALKADHVIIDLRIGDGEPATIFTCDFGYGYVRINAEYHT